MLTKELNEKLTRVGPGTPGGELMRRYWHPVAASVEMEENPVKMVRLLGEDLVLYKDRSGNLGLIDEPLPFLIYSNLAVVITLSGLLLPLAVLPLYSAMLNISRDHVEVARDLGARGRHLLRTILLPMALPGVRTAFAFAFLLAAGDFVTPSLVGGTQSQLIGNIIADQFRGIGSNWPLGAALAFVTIAAVLIVYFAVIRLTRWVTRW